MLGKRIDVMDIIDGNPTDISDANVTAPTQVLETDYGNTPSTDELRQYLGDTQTSTPDISNTNLATPSASPDYLADPQAPDAPPTIESETQHATAQPQEHVHFDTIATEHTDLVEGSRHHVPTESNVVPTVEAAYIAETTAPNQLTNYHVVKGDNLWNLWGDHAKAEISNVQKVAMEQMVRANPEMFGIDSSNPDLIFTGEDINLQAMFDQAQSDGIITIDQNPNGSFEAEMVRVDPPVEAQPSVDTNTSDVAPETVTGTPETSNVELQGGIDSTSGVEDITNYLNSHSENLPITQIAPFLQETMGENFDSLQTSIASEYGGSGVFVESLYVTDPGGEPMIRFSTESVEGQGVLIDYNVAEQQVTEVTKNTQNAGFFDNLMSMFS